jgi:hypothetical protein
MKISRNFWLFGALLSLVGSPATAAETLDAAWLRIIKTEFEPSCAVEHSSTGSVIAGNNGFRSEQWIVQTCLGQFEYRVVYYPQATFPDRASPYEVARVPARGSGTRPNNSFKPNPLRGSA